MTACLLTAPPDTYLRGTTLRTEMVFEDPDADDPDDPYVDPDTVRVFVKRPGDTPDIEEFEYGADVEVVKEDTGRYYLLILADEAGVWGVRWEGEGSWPAVAEKSFRVREGMFAP